MVTRFPHTATIRIKNFTRVNGNPVEGTPTDISITCRVEPQSTGYILGENGNRITTSFKVFLLPISDSVSDGATLIYEGKNYTILKFAKYQTHWVIWV